MPTLFCLNPQNLVRPNVSVAGADTTAVTLTFALYFVIADRKVWGKLSSEIRSKFKDKDEITGPSTAMLPYLTAVINEGDIHSQRISLTSKLSESDR